MNSPNVAPSRRSSTDVALPTVESTSRSTSASSPAASPTVRARSAVSVIIARRNADGSAGGVSQKVGGVLAERHRPLHPGLLVADGAQLLGEHELVERQHERDAGGGGADQRLERRLDGVIRPERGPGVVDEEGGAHEPAEDEREHPRRLVTAGVLALVFCGLVGASLLVDGAGAALRTDDPVETAFQALIGATATGSRSC